MYKTTQKMQYEPQKEYVASKEATTILGVCKKTLIRWRKDGKIKFIKPGKRKYFYCIEDFSPKEMTQPKNNCIYARVSTRGQIKDLETQIEYLRKQYPTYTQIKDIGSGLNFKRNGLKTILEQSSKGTIGEVVVAYKDRFCRFGYELPQWIIESGGGKIVVLNHKNHSPQEELVEDLISIITVFSARIYGLRSYKHKIKKDTVAFDSRTETNN